MVAATASGVFQAAHYRGQQTIDLDDAVKIATVLVGSAISENSLAAVDNYADAADKAEAALKAIKDKAKAAVENIDKHRIDAEMRADATVALALKGSAGQ